MTLYASPLGNQESYLSLITCPYSYTLVLTIFQSYKTFSGSLNRYKPVKLNTPQHYGITPATGICDKGERMFPYNKIVDLWQQPNLFHFGTGCSLKQGSREKVSL